MPVFRAVLKGFAAIGGVRPAFCSPQRCLKGVRALQTCRMQPPNRCIFHLFVTRTCRWGGAARSREGARTKKRPEAGASGLLGGSSRIRRFKRRSVLDAYGGACDATDVLTANAEVTQFAVGHAAEFGYGLTILAPVGERACNVHCHLPLRAVQRFRPVLGGLGSGLNSISV